MAEEETQEQEAQEAESQKAEEEEQHQQEEEEQQSEEDEPRDPGSSMVAEWGYNREGEELEVTFQNGHTESYSLSLQGWEDAKNSPSAGKWMHANVL